MEKGIHHTERSRIMPVPFFSHPIGWLVLGAVGYLIYKSGKKAGEKEAETREESKPVKHKEA
jgi:hypothetical protein